MATSYTTTIKNLKPQSWSRQTVADGQALNNSFLEPTHLKDLKLAEGLDATNDRIDGVNTQITDIQAVIPDDAGSDNKLITTDQVEQKISDVLSNSDLIYLDPVNGDDANDGLTPLTPVKYLKRAAEVFQEKFGGTKVVVKVINTSCPENYQESETWINPGNSTNLFLDDIPAITEAVILNEGGLCLSDQDYQTVPGQHSGSAYPKYYLNVVSDRSIGMYFSTNPIVNSIEAVSKTGDIYITGSYLQELKSMKLTCQNGSLYTSFGPRFNAMLDTETEYYFDALYILGSHTCCAGKKATVISRNEIDISPFNVLSNISTIPNFLTYSLDVYSAGTINFGSSWHYIGTRLSVKSIGGKKASLLLYDIDGHSSDGTGLYSPGDPTKTSYPDIDIDWNGDVYLGYYTGDPSQSHIRMLANNFKMKCRKMSYWGTADLFSRSDIDIELEDGDTNSLARNEHLYADGTVKITSKNALKFLNFIHADNVDITAGGIPEYKPVNRYTDSGSSTADQNRTVIADINARIINAIEFFVGSADSYTTSNYAARYSIRTSGDFSDYGYSIQNGNATVSLDVAGSATISYNSSMLVKRLVLRSDHAYFTNSGVYAASFDIKSSKIQVQNSGRLNQWFSYAGGGWEIGYKNGSSVYNGGSWSHSFEDISIVECDTLEFLNQGFYSGWIRPAYTTDTSGAALKHDWNISVGTLIPFRVSDNSYNGGTEYCSLIGQPFQGAPNSAIMGTIGDVMIGNGQFVSEFKHDWFMNDNDRSYYENYRWNGSTISCHFLKEISQNLYIDFNQGNDAYDGLSKETPVRTMWGLNKAKNKLVNNPATRYVMTIHVMSSSSGSYDSSFGTYFGPENGLDFDYSERNSRNRGLLYNWYAAKYLDDNKATLLPDGWRVPTSSDFSSLTSKNINDIVASDWIGSDKYGLDLCRCLYGFSRSDYSIKAEYCRLWTSTQNDTGSARYYQIEHSISSYTSYKTECYSIRLVKDATGVSDGTRGTVEIGGQTYDTTVIGGKEWLCRNLDYSFTGASFRDRSNPIDNTTDPQCAYAWYSSSGYYNMPFSSCAYLEIVSEQPFLSVTVRGLHSGVCKITGFRNVYVVDTYINCLNIDVSEMLNYVTGYGGYGGYGQPDQWRPSYLVAKARQFFGIGFMSANQTYIEAQSLFKVCSNANSIGSGARPSIVGLFTVVAGNVQFADNTALIENVSVSIEASGGFICDSPPNINHATLKLTTGEYSSTAMFQIQYSAIEINATNTLYFNYLSANSCQLEIKAKHVYFNSETIISDSSIYFDAKEYIELYQPLRLYGNGSSQNRITTQYFILHSNGALYVHGGRYKIDCAVLPLVIRVKSQETGMPAGNTEVFLNADIVQNGVFSIEGNPQSETFDLEAHIRDYRDGKFVTTNQSSFYSGGANITRCKGLIEFYTGTNRDSNLADWRGTVAPNADYEVIVLNKSKQLVAGQGIDISDTGDEIVVSANPKSMIVQVPVTIANGVATAMLSLNRYNVITGIDSTVTDLVIVMPVESTESLLTEVGFEFYLDAFSQTLNSVTFANSTEQLSSIVPDEFTPEHIYQGVLVNRCITLVEYDRPDINVLEINGKKYRTVKIGEQTWMAENLADPNSGVWYDNDQATYEPLGYGKLYTLSEAETIANSVFGWHLPTRNEFEILDGIANYVKFNQEGIVLKSTSGWYNDGDGTNDLGFNFKPAGIGIPSGSSTSFQLATRTGSIITSTPDPANTPTGYFNYNANYDSDVAGFSQVSNSLRASVRLVKDMSVNIGGRDYKVVQIGNQLWMAENLDWKFNTLNFRDSSNNPLDTTTAIQAAYFNYDESTYGADGNKYGLLYNWYAVDYLNNHLSELGVPSGWHVPTRAEWSALVSAVGENPGTKLKSSSGWSSGAGTDDYGFSAVPAGRWYNNRFSYVGSYAHFWTSEPDGSYAWYRYIDTGTSVYESSNSQFSGFCYSVRLVKDSN